MTTILQTMNRHNRRTIARLQDDAVDVYLESKGQDTQGLERLAKRIDHLRNDLQSSEYTRIPYRIHHISVTLWESLGYDAINRTQYMSALPSYTMDDLLSVDYDISLPHTYTCAYIEKAVAHVVSHVPCQERDDVLHDLYVYVMHKRPSKIWHFWPCCLGWLKNWWKLFHYRQHYGRSIDQLLDTDDPTIVYDHDRLTLLATTLDTCERIQDAVNAQHIYQSLPTHIQAIARKRLSKIKLSGNDWAQWQAFAQSEQGQLIAP